MPYSKLLLALAATFAVNGVSANPVATLLTRAESGINCDGNTLHCPGYVGQLQAMLSPLNSIAVGRVYQKGWQLACAGYQVDTNNYGVNLNSHGDGICISVCDNTESYTVGTSTNSQGNSAADILADLIYHGCTACGTAPTVRTGNDLSKGCLTVNYAKSVCGHAGTQGGPAAGAC